MLESMFNENELKNIVKEKYGLEVIKSEKINRGSASITKIYTDKKEYILKEFQEKYNKDFIIKEIDIVNFLSNRNMKVPVYIKCLDGKYYFEENERVVILQEYIDGYTIDNNNGNMDQVIESAKYLGMITKELESYDELWKWDVESWFTKDYLENAIKKHEELLEMFEEEKHYEWVKDDIQEKIEMTKEVIANGDFDDIDKITFKNSHGDYSVQQFIYKDGKINAIIDFVSASCLPICWEIIRSYSYIDKECINGQMNIAHLVEYVKEFEKYVQLNNYDLKYMAYIYLVQILDSTYGYKQYIKKNNEQLLDFAKQRTNFARWLFKNAKDLSSALVEIEN
ncbi:MAG: phosphotransferase [Bacilli bacterium]|nr:phosphotransferase [Bacilli bacterium]